MKAVRVSTGVVVCLSLGSLWVGLSARADVLDNLRNRLFEKRQAVRDIQQRIQQNQERASQKRQEAVTLQNQMEIINDTVEGLSLEIQKTEAQTEEVLAEIASIEQEITDVEKDIKRRRLILREFLRELFVLDQDSSVEMFLKYVTFSEGLARVRALERIEQESHEQLLKIQELRVALAAQKSAFVDLQRELSVFLTRQSSQKKALEDQRAAKARLLEITRAQESEFKKLLATSVAEQKRAQVEITRIDAAIRAELERAGIQRLGRVGTFQWPLEPIFGVACGFHCPDYPYLSLIGPHTGIDIPTPMGTEIRAPADGYVARVHIASGAGYSYILLIHGEQLSTVYGHLSSATVQEGTFVTRGNVLGTTGGAPGTRGAGLSTGPHLHFEVRRNGIPTDPQPYLP